MRKPFFAFEKTKTQISFAVTAKLISAFIFAAHIVQPLFFLNPKFISLWLSSVAAQTGLCRTWTETPKNGFLKTGSFYFFIVSSIKAEFRHA